MESIAIVLANFLSVGIFSVGIIFFLREYINQYVSDAQKKYTHIERELVTMRGAVQQMQSDFKNIFVIDKPTPNEATEETKDEVEFREEDPINLPEDVKFEIEGGDTQIPPQYTKNER